MADHAAAGPSSAGMWMNCPASITLAGGLSRPSSRYTREGTAAHMVAEMILRGELFPPPKIKVEHEEFVVGIPMLRALNPYIDFVQKLMEVCREVYIEEKVKLKGGIVWGTADCAAYSEEMIHIVDLKYGKGVAVSPDSAQLKIYGIAAYDTLWDGHYVSTVNLTIIQPRIDPTPQTVSFTGEELNDWRRRELQPAIDKLIAGDTTEVYGHWCRWCVRKDNCKAFRNHKNSNAADIFDDGLDTLNI